MVTANLKENHAANDDDDDAVVDEANAYAEGSVFRSQAGADSVVDDPGGAPTIKGHCECNGKVKIQDTRE